jgi:hypothetical protein
LRLPLEVRLPLAYISIVETRNAGHERTTTMKDPLMMSQSEKDAELAVIQKFARFVLYVTLGFAALFVVTGSIVSMLH